MVLGIDPIIGSTSDLDGYFKLEKVPVIPDSSYSMVNFTQEWFFSDSLANDGEATNIGIDITLERFLNDNYFWLVTASFFKSTYIGGDGIERHSKYDRSYMINGLSGREFFVGKNGKNNILGISSKVTLQGGDRKSPVNYNESITINPIIFSALVKRSLQF